MAGLGWQELIIVLVIVVIVFGAGKLPEAARSLGQGVKEFRKEAGGTGDSLTASSSSTTGDPVGEERVTVKREMRADDI